MPHTNTSKPVRVYGVPMDLGQKRRGVDMGPSAIRYAGLQKRLSRLGVMVNDCGNIAVPVAEEIEEQRDFDPENGLAHHVPAIAQVCWAVHEQMLATIAADETGIFL